MINWRTKICTVTQSFAGCRRRAGRISQDSRQLTTDAGSIRDISSAGMRISTRHRIAGTKAFTITARGFRPIQLQGDVIWCKRTGLFSFEAGIRFSQVSEKARRQLCNMAQQGAAEINDRAA